VNRLKAASPIVFVAAIFSLPWLSGIHVLGFDQRSLGEIMQVEFLVLVSGLFLIFPVMLPAETRYGQIVRWLFFAGFAVLFAYASSEYGGVRSFVSYFVLLYATFGAAFLVGGLTRSKGSVVAAEGFARWAVSLFVFFPLVVAFDLGAGDIGSWDTRSGVAPAGSLYFLALAFLELVVYPWIKGLTGKL
jgi:hypothetical protein